MTKVHVVRQGECLSSIARQYGFKDALVLYDDPSNAELKKRRPNPNVIMPGDLVAIPLQRVREGNYATGNWHDVDVEVEPLRLKVRLRDISGKALANQSYHLTVDGEERDGTTDGDGLVDEPVTVDAGIAVLKTTVTNGEETQELTFQLTLGALDPTSEVTGVQRRLANLQFYSGTIDGIWGPKTRSALTAFQQSAGLEPSGEPDDATLRSLEQEHDGVA
jgi:N-acetylmuramoyl-L-alanine amidase